MRKLDRQDIEVLVEFGLKQATKTELKHLAGTDRGKRDKALDAISQRICARLDNHHTGVFKTGMIDSAHPVDSRPATWDEDLVIIPGYRL